MWIYRGYDIVMRDGRFVVLTEDKTGDLSSKLKNLDECYAFIDAHKRRTGDLDKTK